MKSTLVILFLVSIVSSCDFLDTNKDAEVIARVNDHYLYKKDLAQSISSKLSPSDSAMKTKTYIDNWAVNKLLLDKSQLNLPEDKQQKFDSLAENYKQELYREAYMNAFINKKMDPEIPDSSLTKYYEKHKQSFKLNDYLLKLRYLELSNSITNKEIILKKFKRFNQDDRLFLNDNTLAFSQYILSDSTWIRSIDMFRQLNHLDSIDKNKFFKPGNQFSINDSTSTYHFKIEEVRPPNNEAPYSYIKPQLKQILVNRKKLTLTSQIKKEIKADAYEDKTFEIYD